MATGFVPPTVRSAPRPMQAKYFREADVDALETAINQWLAERTDREIIEIRQSVLPGDGGPELVVSVWYIEG